MNRRFYIWLVLIVLSFSAWSQETKKKVMPFFSVRELHDVKAVNPNLFTDVNTIFINLQELSKSYVFPLPGSHVISKFGVSRGRRRGHSGIDIKTCANDTIRAAFDGVVRMSQPYYGYGNVIVIRHANGLETLYSHNSKNFVKRGDNVKAGQAIALTGRTGRATTEHLHFETRIDGQYFNPSYIFDFLHHALQKGVVVCTKSGHGVIIKPHKDIVE